MQCMHVYIPVSRACVPNHIYIQRLATIKSQDMS